MLDATILREKTLAQLSKQEVQRQIIEDAFRRSFDQWFTVFRMEVGNALSHAAVKGQWSHDITVQPPQGLLQFHIEAVRQLTEELTTLGFKVRQSDYRTLTVSWR